MKKTYTFEQLDKKLKPCPLCGGCARITSRSMDGMEDKTTVKCMRCGLTLEWTQWLDPTPWGRSILTDDLNFIEAWNRRAEQ